MVECVSKESVNVHQDLLVLPASSNVSSAQNIAKSKLLTSSRHACTSKQTNKQLSMFGVNMVNVVYVKLQYMYIFARCKTVYFKWKIYVR